MFRNEPRLVGRTIDDKEIGCSRCDFDIPDDCAIPQIILRASRIWKHSWHCYRSTGGGRPQRQGYCHQPNKNTSDQATTNQDGNYSVTHLVPDVYTVRIEAPGFKALEQKDVTVSADTGSRADGQFQVGGTQETVEVTAEAPQLKTDRSDVTIEFNQRYVEDLPVL
ncbi:MAG: carboxypeptidase regulatory-like domain-containing protein, partial [Acidobacteria bacterium]|nr:carboxypeptidase regulatory-like domain-containing protein [Acidobacteriota bacterium]